ncbi:MAG: trypsin-like peptidase domain-containing protein [Hyphomicrobiaceae bacterium]|nr:trypsin-like peptidase domain-containing protein [Hyphomicrobiaceae bacterium]
MAEAQVPPGAGSTFTASGMGRSIIPVAMFGGDERRPLDMHSGLRRFIGRLRQAETGSVCSAFCIATNIVATAGHCVQSALENGGLDALRFAIDADRETTGVRIAGAGEGRASFNVLTGASELHTRPPINAVSDWAFLRLERTACPAGGLKFAALPADMLARRSRERRVYHVSYHRDVANWQLMIASPCRVVTDLPQQISALLEQDFDDPRNLLLHDCDTGAASSGSPLLTDGDNGPEVVGINIGTYVRSRVVTHDGEIVQRLASEPIANTALIAASLDHRLVQFIDADVTTRRAAIASMQSRLRAIGLYDGPVDGTFGIATRGAIMAFQRGLGESEIGLPSHRILQQLEELTAANKD